MHQCFVIQPFDGATYDKLYEEVFAPAISAAGVEPYRVDEDPAASVPIESIEKKIEECAVCFAEISTSKPNVWFELGYARAMRKQLCLVREESAGKTLPFDIQHLNVIFHSASAPSDFKALESRITARIKAILEGEDVSQFLRSQPLPNPGRHEPYEVALFGVLAANYLYDADGLVSAFNIKNEMQKAGYNEVATTVALKRLERNGLVRAGTQEGNFGEPFTVYGLTEAGLSWVDTNTQQLNLQYRPTSSGSGGVRPPTDDDIPF